MALWHAKNIYKILQVWFEIHGLKLGKEYNYKCFFFSISDDYPFTEWSFYKHISESKINSKHWLYLSPQGKSDTAASLGIWKRQINFHRMTSLTFAQQLSEHAMALCDKWVKLFTLILYDLLLI